ncbi:hypothetical protein C4B63_65g92 [Trypanosoma cruzi]|uniref:Reverse transcriptase domain-containing protein n=1 Tax=Trypanosoma cruzi TaxID=5693 RepID=A0A2V2UY95_TRYCR|nr:hypothetical protein C4B63_65g92 [Trypanosoma cruzi]
MRPASATGKSACPSFCAVSRAIPPYTAAAARCTPLVPGGWEMDRPFPPYVLDVTIRDSLLGSAPGPGDMLNEFLHRLGPIAHGTLGTMIHNSFANGSLPGSWKLGDAIPIPKPGKDPCRPESHRPITLLSVLLKLAEGMIRRRLSALLPHHPRQLWICASAFYVGRGGTFYRQITRGLNEFGIVEYERPGDDAHTTPSSPPLVVSIDFPTAFDTTDHGKLFCMLDRLPRLDPEPNAGCTTTCGAAMLWYALVNSTPGNNSPQLEHRKAASRDPNSPSTVWMICCTAWATSILPPHSCTLTNTHLLPQVRTSMPVLRQCDRSCLLWPHGLPSTA